jgi:hypothetical protein
MHVAISLLLSKYENVTENSQKQHQHVHIVFIGEGEWWDIKHIAQKTKA